MTSVAKGVFSDNDVVLGKDKVLRLINPGNFGSVYLAQNIIAGRTVALKLIPILEPAEYSKIIEARSQSLSDHPNVVKFFSGDVTSIGGSVYLIIEMEYIAEGSLEDKIKREFVPVAESVEYFIDILFAVERANSLGIIHRDIKVGNILLSKPKPKLSDFGVAYDSNVDIEAMKGLFYRAHAPAEAHSDAVFGPQTDVFCAGVALFTAINNIPGITSLIGLSLPARPFWIAVQEGDLISKIGYESYIPTQVKRIVNKACSFDPSKRYSTCSEFRNQLARLRFRNFWKKTKEIDVWESIREDENKISVVKKKNELYEVVFLKNGRRVNSLCSAHAKIGDARKKMLKTIASTTLV